MWGNPPLHVAAMQGHFTVLRLLIEHNRAEADRCNGFGADAFASHILFSGDVDCVHYMIDAAPQFLTRRLAKMRMGWREWIGVVGSQVAVTIVGQDGTYPNIERLAHSDG